MRGDGCERGAPGSEGEQMGRLEVVPPDDRMAAENALDTGTLIVGEAQRIALRGIIAGEEGLPIPLCIFLAACGLVGIAFSVVAIRMARRP